MPAVQFFAAPLLGELSDRFGRRPVILTSVFGLGCDYVLLAVAPNLWWLFLGRLIAGATSANVAAATAYIADVTRQEDRPRLFGLVGATFGAGFVIGPALGGLLGESGLRLPFIAAAALAFVNVCFGLFVLPESLPPDKRRPLDLGRANPFTLLPGVVRDRALRRLAVAWSCTWIGLGAVQSSLVLFTGYRFGWGAQLNGLVLAGVGLSQAVVEGVLLTPRQRRLGERGTAIARLLLRRARLRAAGAGAGGLDDGAGGGADRAGRPGDALGARHGVRARRGRHPGRDAGRAGRRGGPDRRRGAAADRGAVLRVHLAGGCR